MLKDRIDVFKQICKADNESESIDMNKVESIYDENYENFCDISDTIIGDTSVESISCDIDNEKQEITFHVKGEKPSDITKTFKPTI